MHRRVSDCVSLRYDRWSDGEEVERGSREQIRGRGEKRGERYVAQFSHSAHINIVKGGKEGIGVL